MTPARFVRQKPDPQQQPVRSALTTITNVAHNGAVFFRWVLAAKQLVCLESLMHPRSTVRLLVLTLLAFSPARAQQTLTAAEANKHIGEQGTVCGKVVSTVYAESTRGKPTFLNFDQPYPNQIFTVLIWGSDRSKFDEPETTYRGKRVCATGKLTSFKGVPEIIASEPSQIKIRPSN